MSNNKIIAILAAVCIIVLSFFYEIQARKHQETKTEQAFNDMTRAIQEMSASLKMCGSQNTPCNVVIANLPPPPAVACTVTMPETPKKRGRR